jgi:hypothetical protein
MLIVMFLTAMLFAQDSTQVQMNLNDYLALAKEDLAVQTKKLMLVNMQLSEEEGKKYWPIYDAYFAERSKMMDKAFEMYKVIGKKYGSMTNEDAANIAETFFKLEDDLTQLEKDTYKKIAEELSYLRGIQFLQIQRQINTLLRLQRSSQLPLLK